MLQEIKLQATVLDEQFGLRLDQALSELFSDYSRSRIKCWITDNRVKVNGHIVNKPKEKVAGGDRIIINACIEETRSYASQDLPLNIVYEDEALLVINKPRDVVVHPGAGNPDNTLLNAVLHHCPNSASLPRAGIVHRLDKDTTGLMVIAKTIAAHTRLVTALQDRQITREYEAIASGILMSGGTIDQPIARHPTKRTLMAVFPLGKPAVTHYRIMERFRLHTRLRLRLETGRTHQIRVHMAHITHPLIGDALYGGRPRPPKGASKKLLETLRNFDRQALHAVRLKLVHPITGENMEWQAKLPEDMVELIVALREDKALFQNEIDW